MCIRDRYQRRVHGDSLEIFIENNSQLVQGMLRRTALIALRMVTRQSKRAALVSGKNILLPETSAFHTVSRYFSSAVQGGASAGGEITLKTQDDWEKHVMQSSKPVVLDFYADWCGPCKRLAPILEEKVKGSNGDWVLAKCNIDEFQDLAQALNIQSVPTVILINKGESVDSNLIKSSSSTNQLICLIHTAFVGIPPEKKLNDFFNKASSLAKGKQRRCIKHSIFTQTPLSQCRYIEYPTKMQLA
eukprot:TRINITY_DN6915_c0_g1_i5.p1 TRINITY_DN6915_c0_g1~~TRINITY_DN6915_c0_g1_i5.p1  ORF type:complete len:261 (+),score=46.04 TRINITY_DN6915_c0_g1_i5:49-783(+)